MRACGRSHVPRAAWRACAGTKRRHGRLMYGAGPAACDLSGVGALGPARDGDEYESQRPHGLRAMPELCPIVHSPEKRRSKNRLNLLGVRAPLCSKQTYCGETNRGKSTHSSFRSAALLPRGSSGEPDRLKSTSSVCCAISFPAFGALVAVV
jgi:hypothetical protein